MLPAGGADFAGTFFALTFFAAAFLAGAFLATAFLAGAFLAGAFLATAFLAGAFLATAFLAGAFLAAFFCFVISFLVSLASFDARAFSSFLSNEVLVASNLSNCLVNFLIVLVLLIKNAPMYMCVFTPKGYPKVVLCKFQLIMTVLSHLFSFF